MEEEQRLTAAAKLVKGAVVATLKKPELRETCPAERSPMVSIEAQLSKDELNALRYASGYVPMKILKKKREREKERG